MGGLTNDGPLRETEEEMKFRQWNVGRGVLFIFRVPQTERAWRGEGTPEAGAALNVCRVQRVVLLLFGRNIKERVTHADSSAYQRLFCILQTIMSGILIKDSSLLSWVLQRTIILEVGEGSKWSGTNEYFLLFLLWRAKAMDWCYMLLAAVLQASSFLLLSLTDNWMKEESQFTWTLNYKEGHGDEKKKREEENEEENISPYFCIKKLCKRGECLFLINFLLGSVI